MSRLCGEERSPGSVYLTCATSPWGKPIENFLFCPPKDKPEKMKISANGQTIYPYNGIHHVFDHIGCEHYVNVADWIEETRKQGASRKANPKLDFSKLTPYSKMFFLHARAYIENWLDYHQQFIGCPKDCPDHELPHPPEFCAGLWWEDIEGGEHSEDNHPRFVVRKLAEGEYTGYERPEGVVPLYKEAIFCWLSITRIEVIAGGKKTDENYAKAQASSLPVEIVEE